MPSLLHFYRGVCPFVFYRSIRLSIHQLTFRLFDSKPFPRPYTQDFDTFGTWDNRIEKLPILVEESIKKGKLIPEISIDLVGTASLQGRCKYQEDRFVVMELEKGERIVKTISRAVWM